MNVVDLDSKSNSSNIDRIYKSKTKSGLGLKQIRVV